MSRLFAEQLESRQLFSSSVGPATVFDSAVRADEKQLYVNFEQFNKDAFKSNAAFLRDAKGIKSQNLSQAPSAKSALATFVAAVAPAKLELRSDNLKESPTVVADEKAIIVEQRKLGHDAGNATAESADQAQLLTDRQQVQTDLDTLIQNRFTARENLYNAILQDASSVGSALSSDTQESTKLSAEATQLNTDATNCSNTLSTDLGNASTTATQFDTDLTASQSQQ